MLVKLLGAYGVVPTLPTPTEPITMPHLPSPEGTGGCWFIQDLTFYGNVLFQAALLQEIFTSDTRTALIQEELVVALIALPGCFVAGVFMSALPHPTLLEASHHTIKIY